MRWRSRRFGADPHKVAAAVGYMVQTKLFEKVNGLYVKYSKGKPMITNLSDDQQSKLAPKGAADTYALQKHGISTQSGIPYASHPCAGAYDLVRLLCRGTGI
jgi:hypothetical protein